jgi:hypothetical protein
MNDDADALAAENIVTRLARQPWIPAALLCAMTGCLAVSLAWAKWLYADTAYVNAVWLGLLCGAAVAAARIRRGTAWAYSVCLSAICGCEFAAGILRAVWTTKVDVLWAMHLRLEAFVVRVNSWAAALSANQAIHDTGFFILLVVVISWNATAWVAWCLIRHRRVFEGMLPAGILLALNIHLSGQEPVLLGVYMGTAILLMAYASQVAQQSDWDRRGVDYPEDVGLTAGVSAVIIACMIFAAAQAAPVVGTPKGWHALGDFFQSAQQQTAKVATRLFSGVNPPRISPVPQAGQPNGSGPGAAAPTAGAAGVAIAAFPPNLELIGQPPDQSSATVMWVQTSDPPPLAPDVAGRTSQVAPPQHYWGTELFATYTGTGWQPVDFSEAPEGAVSPSLAAGRYSLWQHFEIAAAHGDRLFAVTMPVTATAELRVRRTALGDSAVVEGVLSNYDVVSWAGNATVAQLESAKADYPADITRLYLQLPASLPQRVRDLADSLTANDHTAYDRALHIQAYLRANYAYTLNVPPPPAGRDAVDYFLFEAPGGFCSYYASAMAVMLRAVGVPARVVTGYAMGEYDFAHRAYRVPGEAAHAWVEVYFPVYGWVEFEPTAGRTEFTRQAGIQPGLPSALSGPPQVSWLKVNWGLLFIALIVTGPVAAAWRFVRSLEPGWSTPRGQARALYRQLRSALAAAGLTATESMTPAEFMAVHREPLSEHPAIWQALSGATQLYLQATFSGHPPRPAQTEQARQLWWRAQWEWLGLWGQARWAGLAGRRPFVFRPYSVVKSFFGGKRHD